MNREKIYDIKLDEQTKDLVLISFKIEGMGPLEYGALITDTEDGWVGKILVSGVLTNLNFDKVGRFLLDHPSIRMKVIVEHPELYDRKKQLI